MTRTILTLLLLATVSFTLSAEISLLATTPSDHNNPCNGTITVRATGSAGPFTIYVYDHVLDVEIEHVDVSGDIKLEGLCNASYDVEVYPTRFPTCGKSMKAFVKEETKAVVGAPIDFSDLVAGELQVRVRPNPTAGPVEVTIRGLPPLLEKTVLGDWSISILDGVGQVGREVSFSGKADAMQSGRFPLDLKGLKKGLYFIRVIRSDGAEGVGRVLLQ